MECKQCSFAQCFSRSRDWPFRLCLTSNDKAELDLLHRLFLGPLNFHSRIVLIDEYGEKLIFVSGLLNHLECDQLCGKIFFELT